MNLSNLASKVCRRGDTDTFESEWTLTVAASFIEPSVCIKLVFFLSVLTAEFSYSSSELCLRFLLASLSFFLM